MSRARFYLTVTITWADVQKHWSPPSPELSFECRKHGFTGVAQRLDEHALRRGPHLGVSAQSKADAAMAATSASS